MVLARLLRAERYPFLRSAFVLSHIPAILVIALYPLLPPRWVPGMPFAVTAPEGLNGAMHNATAAAASQHVGYPIFIAASTVWLTNRARLSWLAFLYPAAVYVIVVGTANHYTLDAIIGGLCIVFGFATARLLHGPLPVAPGARLTPPLALALLAALGYACIVRAIDTAERPDAAAEPGQRNRPGARGGTCAVLAAWWLSRGDPSGSESRPQRPAAGRPLRRLMPVYVALLRGVNVGGARKLPMKELAPALAELGLEDVVTYIQSGNVVFRAPSGGRAKLVSQIEQAIETAFGLDVTVMLRTPAELAKIVAANPFGEPTGEAARRVPRPQAREGGAREARPRPLAARRVRRRGTEVYLRFPNGYGRTKLGGDYFERMLGVRATARNWRTVTKLLELAVT